MEKQKPDKNTTTKLYRNTVNKINKQLEKQTNKEKKKTRKLNQPSIDSIDDN